MTGKEIRLAGYFSFDRDLLKDLRHVVHERLLEHLRSAEEAQAATSKAIEVIDVSEYRPRRIPSAKWRELIKKVWEADRLLCPKCSREMRMVPLIDERVSRPA